MVMELKGDTGAAPMFWEPDIVLRVLEDTIKEARLSGCQSVGSEHLLLALVKLKLGCLSDQPSMASIVLSKFGVTEERLRDAIREVKDSWSYCPR